MQTYETPITVDNWKQAEKAAIEIHERASRKKRQSRLIRSVSVYTMTLTIIVAAYGVLRRIGFASLLFGDYDALPWLNSIWEAVFGHVFDVSALWYIRYPLIVIEVILIPAAISGILALMTVKLKGYSPPLYRDDPRSRATVLRDIVTCREGFGVQVIICASVTTVLFIALIVAENVLSKSDAGVVLSLSYDEKAVIRYAAGVVGVFAGTALISTLSSLVSRLFYYDSGKAATRMMSDLYDFLHTAPKEEKAETQEKKETEDEEQKLYRRFLDK